MLIYRLIGELFTMPQFIVRAVTLALQALASWFRQLEMAVFIMELDAARRYQLLTGIDLGTAGGEASRYAALDPERNEEIQRLGYEQWRAGQAPEDTGE